MECSERIPENRTLARFSICRRHHAIIANQFLMSGENPATLNPKCTSQGTGVNGPNRFKASRSLKMTEFHSRFCSMSNEFPKTKSPITSKPNQLKSVATAVDLPAATSVAICSSSIRTYFKALSLYRATAAIGFSLMYSASGKNIQPLVEKPWSHVRRRLS